MAGFAGGVATFVVLLMLVAAAAAHVRAPGELPAALRAHGVVPRPDVVARTVTVAELVLAVAIIAGLLGSGLSAGLIGSAALFAGYGGYGWYVVASGRSGPCGCGTGETPMSGWVAGRALVLAALSVTGLVWFEPLGGAELAVVLLAAGTFAALLWHLPVAMRDLEAVR